MKENAKVLKINRNINIKATTNEGLGFMEKRNRRFAVALVKELWDV
jgi:2C-methyl-D-erythritol 2,4-cyclodiphosphate synthase